MKVLFLYYHLPDYKTGGSFSTIDTLKALQKNNINVTLAAINNNKFPGNPENVKHLANKIYTNEELVDLRIKPINALKNLLFSKLPYNLERFYSPLFTKVLENINEDFDLIHLDTIHIGLYLDVLKKFKAPVVVRAHNVEYEIYKRLANNLSFPKKQYMNILWKRMKKFEEETLQKINGLIALTQKDLNNLKALGYKGPAEAIPFGMWKENCEYTPIEIEENTVGFIGSLHWQPNIEGILWFLENVVPILIQKKPDIKIFIAGRSAPKSLFKYNSNNVKIVGEVPSSKDFIKKHAVILSPILSGSGLRVKIIEAMAYGKYVVSTTIGAEGIAEKDTDFIRIADEPEDYANKILEGLQNPELRNKIKQNAYDNIMQNFLWDNLGKRIVNFYNKILENENKR